MTRGLCTFSILTAISMIGLTGIAVILIKSNNKITDQKHFNLLKSKLESEINQRVSVYKYGLMGTRSAFIANGNIERDDFYRLISARLLEEEFPAVTGIGYIEHVPLDQLDQFLKETRSGGLPDYTITRLKDTMDEPDYMLIKYIEPVLSNRQAIGLDIGSESSRREAATLAMQTGHATLTGRITLVQASREGAGFLLLLPLYNTARTPRNIQQRVQSIKGWVYMTILAERVFSDITQNINSELDFAVYDNKIMKPENLLFDQDYLSETSHEISAQNSRYHEVVDILFGGKKLTASIRTTAHFKATTNTSAWLIGWGGCVVTILLTMLIQSQATAVSRANQIATNMTTDLRTNVIHLNEAMQSAEEARNSAEHANATKSDFLATMSHEIRTPLNGILGMTSVLSQSQLTTEQRANVRTVIHSSEALLAIINDILDISKIEAGKLELEKIDFAPQSVAKEIMELLQFMAKDKGLKLNLEIEDNVPSWVNGDPVRTRQIILNLMNNALKFTHQGSVALHIKLQSQNNNKLMMHFAIKDTGPGIDQASHDRLFEKFSQMDVSTTRKHGGTGLGLAICKSLTKMMHGEINLESELGQGSTFWFTLEYETAIEPQNPNEAPQVHINQKIAPQTIQKSHLLVVDDNAVNRMVAGKMLEIIGVQVTLAQSASEAFEYAKSNRYDIILMDCQMPVMDGFEATMHLRKQNHYATPASVPIIALTANAAITDRTQCLDAGMSDFLAKPVTLEKFSQMIHKWLVDSDHIAA